jgi:tRNA-2-methylthio-N6-dimethylallyladenosine synthase
MSSCEIKSLPSQKDAAKRSEVTPRLISSNVVPPALKAFAQGKTYSIRTYGCQANIRDEEIFAGYLERAGFTKAASFEEANLVLINTCAVRENAEEKIYGEIGLCKARKEADPDFLLVLAGCVMGENGVAEKLMSTYPYISLIIGTHDVANILTLLDEVVRRRKAIVDVRSFAGEVVESLPSVRLSPFEAFVNISYGCDKFCTYCIVPYTRGGKEAATPKTSSKSARIW